ncbi:MAG: tRNA (adenosine(37)-N6)-threonylcarbamoyltransferase complex ATPase subunit type 1 TsaE [Gemmatimonadales bacterium]
MHVGSRLVGLPALSDLAGKLLRETGPGTVVWLEGELGSGKTTFVSLVVAAAGGGRATSPTFSLVHTYPTPQGSIVHSDCYRLRQPDEAIDLGLLETLTDVRMLLIEWPDRGRGFVPDCDVRIVFEHDNDPDARRISVERC